MKRYTSIELLRFFTAITVLLYHYRHFFSPLNITSNQNYNLIKNDLPFNFFIEKFYEFGFYGVHVFYTISGFVFAYVYLSTIVKFSQTIFRKPFCKALSSTLGNFDLCNYISIFIFTK